MTREGNLLHLLRNAPVREIERTLLRDGFGFVLRRQTRTGGRVYRHPDGSTPILHYHHGGDTLPRGTLADVLAATRWTEDEARRLSLIS